MREFRLEKFIHLDDALIWIEKELYELIPFESAMKAELSLIDGEWRAAIITETVQGDLFD